MLTFACYRKQDIVRNRIRGYQIFGIPLVGLGRGLMTLVRDNLPAQLISNPIFCGEDVETLEVSVALLHTLLHIVNVYLPAVAELELGELFSLGGEALLIVGGDLNAHHPMLSSPAPPNAAGVALVIALEDSDSIHLLNTPVAMHKRGGVLDLTFVSSALRPLAT